MEKKELKRFIKYCIVGFTGIIVNMLVLYFFTDILGIFYILSSMISYEVSIITNFLINDIWTFKEVIVPGQSHSFLVRAMYFNYTMITGAIVSILLLYIFTEFLSINYILSNMFAIVITVIYRYYASITLVWK